jgi:hypothetical protein
MPLTPEQQKELRQLELEQLEEEEADYQAQQAATKPAVAPRMQEPDTPVSSPEATARGLADVLTLGTAKYTAPVIRSGLQAVLPKGVNELLNLKPYEVEKAKYEEREDIAKQYEPASYIGGQAFGMGSQILGGIPLRGAASLLGAGRAAAPEAVSAGRAAATRSFESPMGQAALGGFQAGAESKFDPLEVLKGATIGGGLTFLGSLGARWAQPTLERGAAGMAAKATGADIDKPSRNISRMPGGRQAYGRDVLEQGITSPFRSVAGAAENAAAQRRQYGEEIGDIYRQLDEMEGIEVPANHMERVFNRINREVVQPLNDVTATRGTARRLDTNFLNDLRNRVEAGDRFTYRQLHREQSRLGDAAYGQGSYDNPVKRELRNVERIMREELQNAASRTNPGSELIENLRNTNRRYAVATVAAETAEDKVRRMAKNRGFSLSDYVLGAGGLAAGAQSDIGALLGAGGAMAVNRYLREYGPQQTAALLNMAQRMARDNPDQIGAYVNFLLGEQVTKFLGGKEK